ncbi:MAG: hypothetical protein WBP41_10795 [Saprospiraceae bacterium]
MRKVNFRVINICLLSFCIIISSSLFSCAQNPSGNSEGSDYFKKKYKFKPLTVDELPDSLSRLLYVPFQENGKYYIADYAGKRVSKKSWDKIYTFGQIPFFYGEQNGLSRLYRYPEIVIIDRGMKIDFLKSLPAFNIEKDMYGEGIYSLTIDSILSLGGSDKTYSKLVEQLGGRSVKTIYYFGKDQNTAIKECYFKPSRPLSKSEPSFRKPSYRDEYMHSHIVVFTFNQGFNILDLSGRRVFKQDFYDILYLNDNYIIGRNQNAKLAVASLTTGQVSAYNFDTITFIPGCDSTFHAGIRHGNQIEWNLLTLDGRYFPVTERYENCDSLEAPKIVPVAQKITRSFSNPSDNKVGVKDELDSIILDPVYEYAHVMNKLRWVAVKKDGQYGVYNLDGYWLFPMESRQLYLTEFTDSTARFTIEENGQNFIFNEKFELLQENPVVFFETSHFDWNSVPDSIRPMLTKVNRPTSYQEYCVFNDEKYGHVFTADGKYISSHKGRYDENVSFVGLARDKKRFGKRFIPVGKFIEDHTDYYVRLTDGFEYRK